MGLREMLIDANGITGDRSRDVERVRKGLLHIGGQIVLEPTANELLTLIPWFMDGTSSGSGDITYILGISAALNYVELDKGLSVNLYDKVAVNRIVISGSQGEALRMSFDLIGCTDTPFSAGTFPSLSFDRTTAPFVFTDSGPTGITINGVTVTPKSWTLTLDNHIDPNRFFNSITLIKPVALDRTVTLSLDVPYDTAHAALYGAGAGGVVASLNHTNGAQKLNFLFPALTFPRESIDIPGRVEEMYRINGTAYRTGGTSEFSILMNATPI